MTWIELLYPIKEVGLTNDHKLTTQHLLQEPEVMQGLKNHHRWPNPEIDLYLSSLGPQPLPQEGLDVVGSLPPHG